MTHQHYELAQIAIDTMQVVYLNEEKVVLVDSSDNEWYLDTGASNHMTGDKNTFTSLDDHMKGKVKFRDGSMVDI